MTDALHNSESATLSRAHQAAPTAAPLDRLSPWTWDVTDVEWTIATGITCVLVWCAVAVTR